MALAASYFLTAGHSHAQEVANLVAPDPFAREAIVRMLHQANDWQTAHPRMKPGDRNRIRATWYTGVMAAYKATRDEKFLDQAMDWGRQHKWQVGTENPGSNRLFCVETWAELALLKQDKSMVAPALEALATPTPNSPAGARVWYLEGGVRNGILDKETYLPVVKKACAGLAACLSPEGMVQWGQQVGAAPGIIEQNQTDEYVTGTFLLAGSEILRLLDAGLLENVPRK